MDHQGISSVQQDWNQFQLKFSNIEVFFIRIDVLKNVYL